MCEAMNIVVKMTAAEAPWSNGLCERHNEVSSKMMIKLRLIQSAVLSLLCFGQYMQKTLQLTYMDFHLTKLH